MVRKMSFKMKMSAYKLDFPLDTAIKSSNDFREDEI